MHCKVSVTVFDYVADFLYIAISSEYIKNYFSEKRRSHL